MKYLHMLELLKYLKMELFKWNISILFLSAETLFMSHFLTSYYPIYSESYYNV